MIALTFAHAAYLYALLIVLPLTAFVWYVGFKQRLKAREQYGEDRLVSRYTAKPQLAREIFELGAWLSFLALITVAAAGPLMSDVPQTARTGSLQVVVVLDVSRSQAAEDYRDILPAADGTQGSHVLGPHGSRLDMAKHIITTKILPAVPGNQVGLVTYKGSGFPKSDLTDDFAALRFVISNWVTIGEAPGGGSDFAEGLKEALETFKRDEDPSKEKVIVLFSDGGFTGNAKDLSKVTQEIVQQHIRLIVIGLGMPQPVPIPVYDKGQLTGYLQKDGTTVTTAIDEAPLPCRRNKYFQEEKERGSRRA